jgi:hypothetical protein
VAHPVFLVFVVAGVLAIVHRREFARQIVQQQQTLLPKGLVMSESLCRIMTLIGGILFIVLGLLATVDAVPRK